MCGGVRIADTENDALETCKVEKDGEAYCRTIKGKARCLTASCVFHNR